MSTSNTERPDALLRRGLVLEYATLSWNVVGVIVIGIAASKARSVGLAGFGLDSLIEIFASVVVVWQLTDATKDREKQALKLISLAFGMLAVYLLVQIAIAFAVGLHPLPSELGLWWLALTFVVMCGLARAKRVTGRRLDNAVLISEASVTLVDAALAGAVLIGVGLNALMGWWWADPISGLIVLGYAIKEGIGAWKHSALSEVTTASPL